MPKQAKLYVVGQLQGDRFIFHPNNISLIYKAFQNSNMKKMESGNKYIFHNVKIDLQENNGVKFSLLRNADKILITKYFQKGGEANVLRVVGEIGWDKKERQARMQIYNTPKILKERTATSWTTAQQIKKEAKKEIKDIQAIEGNKGKKLFSYRNENFNVNIVDSEGTLTKNKSQANKEIKKQKEKKVAILMDTVPGKTLIEILNPITQPWARTPNSEKLILGLEFIRKLNMLHKLGIVHRDIQSKNIMYDQKNRNVHIIDPSFSLPEGKKGFSLQGTPYYMAPEAWKQAQITADPKYDIFSASAQLGAILGGTYDNITRPRKNEIEKMDNSLKREHEEKIQKIKEKYKDPEKVKQEVAKEKKAYSALKENNMNLLAAFEFTGYSFSEIADPHLKKLLESMAEIKPEKRPTGDAVMVMLMKKLAEENQQEFNNYLITSLKNELIEISKNLTEEIKYQESLPIYKKDKHTIARLEKSNAVAKECFARLKNENFSKDLRSSLREVEAMLNKLSDNKWLKKDSPNTKRLLILQDNIGYMKPHEGPEATKRHSHEPKRKSTKRFSTPPNRQPPPVPPRRPKQSPTN